MYYRISNPSDIRDLGEQMAAWIAADNPKAADWAEQPPAPSPDAIWTSAGEWVILPPEPVTPRWVQFGAALAADVPVNEWFGALFPQAPVLHGMISVGLGQAAQGDPKTFLAAWSQALAAGLVSLELAESVAAMAASFDLPAEFVAALTAPPPTP